MEPGYGQGGRPRWWEQAHCKSPAYTEAVQDEQKAPPSGKRNKLSKPARPLNKERWAGGVDSVGSATLANLLSMTSYGGAIAACGLAGGMDLPSSVAPFILRGVCLLGIDSVMCPIDKRRTAWQRLSTDLDPSKLVEITSEISLEQVPDFAAKILAGQVRGRIVVKIG